jgi:hypothetical protein
MIGPVRAFAAAAVGEWLRAGPSRAAIRSATSNALYRKGMPGWVREDDSPLRMRVERRDSGERKCLRHGDRSDAAEPGGCRRIAVQGRPGDREI